MPDPGDPIGDDFIAVLVRRSVVSSSEPATVTMPWNGGPLSVPAFINGCIVLAAVKIPTWNKPGDVHRFAVVFTDNGRQGGTDGTLVVAVVSGGVGYRVREKTVGWTSYATAALHMFSLTGLTPDTDQDLTGTEGQQAN